ncbi:MAG: M36 family metallopeptidase [Flavobacteriales bacterium]
MNGGTLLSFDAPLDLGREPHAYLDAAIIQLFYANNMCHDVAHSYGFHAAAGNFQENNYGHGGVAGDAVQAQAQDGTGTNNANFFTPQDGRPGRMQMYRWAYTTPMRDSDLDNLVIAHEYAHGISNRLVGGPMNVDCLWNAEQMGEGWSDYFGLMLTMKPGDQGTGSAGVGNYLRGQPATGQGIRPAPYSTDLGVNAYTYANTNAGVSQPHGIGFVWCTMLWEMTWDLIAQYGFDPDLYNGAAGNNRALRLVVEAMKLTPCEPGFVDARNAILEADRILYGGADQALIWAAFARRGLGFSADQGDPDDRTDQVEAFDLPPAADVELLYLLSPEPGHVPTCALGILNVECVVRNLGTAPQGLIPVQYRVDNGPVQGTILGGPLQPGQRDTLTFSGQITGLLQTAGTHIVQVWTALSGDGNLSNDTATAVVTTYAAPFIALPYTENFEQEAIPALNLPCDQVGLTNGWYNVPEPYYASYSSEGESLNMRVADGLTRPQPDPYNYPEFDHTSGSSSGHYLRADPGCKQNNANGKEARLISPCFSTNGIIAPKFDLAFWMNIGSNTYFLVDGWWNGRWHQLSEGQVRPDSVETWNEARITLPANIAGNMVLRLMIKDDVSEHSCLDDIRLHDTFEPLTAALAVERGAWCRGEVVRLSDASLNADPTTTWTWSVSPTTYVPLNGTDLHSRTLELMPLDTGLYQVQLIAGNGFDADTVELAGGFRVNEGSGHSLLVRTDQWGSDLTWQVRTPGGAVHASGGPYTDHPMIGTYPQAIEQFCLPGEGCYELVLNDPFDGICCDYGNGSVELFDANGHLLVQGTMNDTEIPQKVFPFCTPAACIQLPWSENFESGHAGWTQDPTDNSDWSWSNAVITSSQGSDHTTGSGYSYQLRGGGTVQRHAQLRSPCIDLNGAIAPVLSFWYMDHPLSGDTLFLDLERNGHVYEGIWQSPYGSSGAWRQVTFDLSNYSGASITLQFRASKNFQGGSGIALDDLQITGNAGLHFSLNMALEGPFDTNTGLMRDDLRTKGLLPLVEPYTALGHTHSGGGGNEEMAPGLLSTKGPHALVDWVLLELRDGNDPTNIVATKSALLRRDGTVVDITGSTDLAFPIPLDVYYLRAAHRNHLGSMLATGLEFDIPAPVLDFRDPDPSLILGAEARKLLGGTAVLWAGDVNGNGQIKYTGGGNDRDRILSVIGGVVPTTIASGYLPADVDLNGEVKYTGANNDRDRILQNIGGVVPTNTRNETMP